MKSALEINQGKVLNSVLRKNEKTSDQSLRSSHAESTSKLYNQLGRNLSGFVEVLSEVSKQNSTSSMFCLLNLPFKDIEPTLLTKQRKKHHQSGLLPIKSSGDIELDALRNYLKVNH